MGITIVYLVSGRREKSLSSLQQGLNGLKQISCTGEINIVFVFDGENWKYQPIVRMIYSDFPNATTIFEHECSNPGLLYNRAMAHVNGEYVCFFSLSTEHIQKRINAFQKCIEEKCSDSIYYLNSQPDMNFYQGNNLKYGVLQILMPYSLDDFVIKSCVVRNFMFNENILIQNKFSQEFLLRLAREFDFKEIGYIEPNVHGIQVLKRLNVSSRLTDSYLVRSGALWEKEIEDKFDAEFINDLDDEDYETVSRVFRNDFIHKNKKVRKILILGGIWEYHHIQVVFLNYLEKLIGSGFATYVVGYDEFFVKENLIDYDIVFFCRCRSDNGVELAKYCKKNRIKSIYMLDDNWLSIAKDYPKEGAIFVEGNSNFDNFIEIVKMCNAVLYFNDLIKEDLMPYTNSFIKFKISVNPKTFISSDNNKTKRSKYIVGYAGSLRYENIAFEALSKVAKDRDDVTVLLIGGISEEQLKLFNGTDYIKYDFVTYKKYASIMKEMKPDLLIAPLQANRTSSSKCFNKYIESGINGAACVFSKVEPYTQVVIDGKNGYYVENNSVEAWYKKINEILDNPVGLNEVKNNVIQDVLENYSVDVVVNDFKKMIDKIEEL